MTLRQENIMEAATLMTGNAIPWIDVTSHRRSDMVSFQVFLSSKK
jgi:hypothetical protein